MGGALKQAHPAMGYPLGLLIWLGAYVIGNILGRIIASMQGWDNFSYDRAGGVFYAGVQAGLGTYLALTASKAWLGHGKFVRVWLLILVFLATALAFVAVVGAVYFGRIDELGWNTLALVVSLIVTETVRRVPEDDI